MAPYGEHQPKNCSWIIGGDFNITERSNDKYNDCGKAICDLERFSWNDLLNVFEVHAWGQHSPKIRNYMQSKRGSSKMMVSKKIEVGLK